MSSRWFALLRSAFFAALFAALWIWFVPRWIAAARGVTLELRTNAAAPALMIVGAAIMVRCVFDFAWTGRGTPAPFDPPRHLVVRGLYRWVRETFIGKPRPIQGLRAWQPPTRVCYASAALEWRRRRCAHPVARLSWLPPSPSCPRGRWRSTNTSTLTPRRKSSAGSIFPSRASPRFS